MVSNKLIYGYVPQNIVTADWDARFIYCSDAISHEMIKKTSDSRSLVHQASYLDVLDLVGP